MATEALGQATGDSGGTSVTTGAADTKGAWVELLASSSADTEWIDIFCYGPAAADNSFLLDIGVGAAASESVVIANIAFQANSAQGTRIGIPLTIASGSRISARAQADVSTRTFEVSGHISTESSYGTSASNITLGADTANSIGVPIDAGATPNTKGAWAEVDASTSADIDYFVVLIGPNDNAVITAEAGFLIDIATGASSSEVVLIGDIEYRQNNLEVFFGREAPYFEAIASGTRVAARCQSTESDATDRIIDVSIIGCNMTAPAGGGGGGIKLAGRGGGLAG